MLPPYIAGYAVNAMVALASSPGRAPVALGSLAARHRVSPSCLDQLLRAMVHAQLVLRRGSGSGYVLARDPHDITLGDIVRAARESVDCAGYTAGEGSVPHDASGVPAGLPWGPRDEGIYGLLDGLTLADLSTGAGDRPAGIPVPDQAHSIAGDLAPLHGKVLAFLESLQAAYTLQQSVVDGLDEPIMVIGADYRVQLMNRAAAQFAAIEPAAGDALLCHRISHHSPTPCDGTAHPCPLRQVRESGRSVTVVHEHYQADGERRIVEVIASPLRDPDGACQGIVESVRDVTERTEAEEALRRYAARLRALGERLAQVSETERQRLARELHDQVGRNLTALGINLNILQTQMPVDLLPIVHARLRDSLALVEQTTKQIRDVMSELRPPVLDDYGLFAALHWYAEQYAARTGIRVVVHGEELDGRLDEAVENALFRIAQEALNNVAKHAHASEATVSLELSDGLLCLVVGDDGIGFDPLQIACCPEDRGWGMLTMSERAEAIGGRCVVESSPGHGTQVLVEVAA